LDTLVTPRLFLVQTPLEVLKTRLTTDDFMARVSIDGQAASLSARTELDVHFPPEWPGEALDLFPLWLARREATPQQDDWGGTVIDRSDLVAVGQMGFKGPPDQTLSVEIGYGINASYQGRGYATEMAGALVAWALNQPEVRKVTAKCLADNTASIRVLEKAGLRRIGSGSDVEGRMIMWERLR
jgi:ribosomal-protein-alanine N-acetyltransferase